MSDHRLICIADDGSAYAEVYALLQHAGWDVHRTASVAGAARLLQTEGFLVGLLLAATPADRFLEQLESFVEAHGRQAWVGAFGAASLTSDACKRLILDHLFDHHTLPADGARLLQTLGHAMGHAALRQNSRSNDVARPNDCAIVGQSAAIATLLRQIRRVAQVDVPVLISGESGSGKELAAQAIQQYSARAQGPFVSINCCAIPPALIQSELFGHVRGAFTGADRDKRGLFEAANGGIIFLDEIGDLTMELQVNLLRVLQEKTIMRVGTTQSLPVDARVIAASHVDLQSAVATGRFREDLYYRLNVLPLNVPPLRERRSDIEVLAQHFFKQYSADKSPGLKGFGQRALTVMAAYDWPGNVRELINRVRRAMVMAEGRLITPEDLGIPEAGTPEISWDALDDARNEAERSAIFLSLSHSRRNVTLAAKHLGVSRATMYRLMAKYDISSH